MQRSFGLHTIKRLRTFRESALQSLARISLGNELMGHKTREAGVRNCGQNGGVVQFLAGVQIVAPRIATSVKVRARSCGSRRPPLFACDRCRTAAARLMRLPACTPAIPRPCGQLDIQGGPRGC